MLIDVVLQELIVTSASFKRTTPLPCDAPKFEPLITTWLPTDAVVAETPVITGAGLAVELTDTLSNVPVNKLLVLPLLIPSPMYTFWAMLIVTLVPTCIQFTPSVAMYALKTLPLRTSFNQNGTAVDIDGRLGFWVNCWYDVPAPVVARP
jgi:hypothetical protein